MTWEKFIQILFCLMVLYTVCLCLFISSLYAAAEKITKLECVTTANSGLYETTYGSNW